MTPMNKSHFGAALAAVVFVAALWPATARGQAQAAPQDKPKTQERSGMRERAREALNVTPEQEKKIQEFRELRQKDSQAFREQMTKMRGEMRDLMKDPKANAAKIDGLIDNMAKLRADREKMAYRSRGEIEKIFTPEQLAKIKEFRGRFAGRFGMAGRGGMGFGRPWMGRRGFGMRGRMAWGWRMRHSDRFWRRPWFDWLW